MENREEILKSLGVNSIFGKVRVAVELLRTIDDPSKSDIKYGVNRLVQNALNESTPQQVDELMAAHPGLASLYEDGYDPQIDIAALERLPDGTLGREFARFVKANGIDPLDRLLPSSKKARHPLEYVILRAYKLHDILHVVLGCDTSVEGEIRIVSFSYGQAQSRASAVALGTLLLHLAIKEPRAIMTALRTALEWFEKGRSYPPHVTFKFEEHWSKRVEEVHDAIKAA